MKAKKFTRNRNIFRHSKSASIQGQERAWRHVDKVDRVELSTKFLQALAKCPDAGISVSFARETFEGGDWLVQHQAHGHHFPIRIKLGSERIALPQLDLPVIVAQPEAGDDSEKLTAADRYTPSVFSFSR